VHHDTVMKVTNKMQLYRLIYFCLSALHVSGDVFTHHQEHLTVFTVSASFHCNNKIIVASNVFFVLGYLGYIIDICVRHCCCCFLSYIFVSVS
jgi:hypothetical protein